MNRKSEDLLPLEAEVLETALELQVQGMLEFHGFLIARKMRDRKDARRLTAHGTLYKALSRMQRSGWLSSHWEDPSVAGEEGRPFRRLYRPTAAGAHALARYRSEVKAAASLRLAEGGARV